MTVARRLRQQVHVDRVTRHQLGDERLLADAGQVVGGRVLHREEMPAETFPERAPAVGVELAAQLGDHLRREAVGELGDEQEPALREQRPVLRVAERLVEEQRAELGVARVVVGEEERRRDRVDRQRARRVDDRADAVVVPGLGQPDRGLDRADPDDAAARRFDEHEDVAFVGRATPCARTTRASGRCARRAARGSRAASSDRGRCARTARAPPAGRPARSGGRGTPIGSASHHASSPRRRGPSVFAANDTGFPRSRE